MEANSPFSPRAGAFTIASLMSEGADGALYPNPGPAPGYQTLAPPPGTRGECGYFDWGQTNGYAPGLKAMEGELVQYFI